MVIKAIKSICLAAVLCLAVLLSACSGSTGQTVTDTAEASLPQTAAEPDTTEVPEGSKDVPQTTLMPETSAAPESTETEEPETKTQEPLYPIEMDPETLIKLVRDWDESLDQYTGTAHDGKVLLRADFYKGSKNEYSGCERYAYDRLGNNRIWAMFSQQGSLYLWGVREYDENGFPSSQTVYDGYCAVAYKYVYACDSSGRVIRSSYYDRKLIQGKDFDWEKSEPTERNEYELDEKGNQVRTLHYSGGILDSVTESEYTKGGSRTVTRTYDPDGTLKEHSENVYDEEEHLIAEIEYSVGTGKEINRINNIWSDGFHKCRKEWVFNAKDHGSYVYYYDDDGDYTMIECYDAEGRLDTKNVLIYSD